MQVEKFEEDFERIQNMIIAETSGLALRLNLSETELYDAFVEWLQS